MQVIDQFDTVVRFNSFVTRDLEYSTGTKTTIWCHMMQWFHASGIDPATHKQVDQHSPSTLASRRG